IAAATTFPRREPHAGTTGRRPTATLLALGLVGGSIPFVLFFEGLARASSTQAAFIHKTLLLWVAALAVPLLRERVGLPHLGAFALLIAGQAALTGGSGGFGWGAGESMVLAATLLWAVELVIAKRLLRSFGSSTLAVARMGVGSVALLGWLAVTDRLELLLGLGASQWAWALGTGAILAAFVGTWFAALARAQAVDVTAVLVFGAVVTGVLASGVQGAPLASQAPGLLLVTVGTAIIAATALRPVPAPARETT
ncbi:MAG TPA: DMT family transporter, partial [Actinomycetota bacterium]